MASPEENPIRMKRRTKAFADELVNNPKISATEAYIRTHETENRNAAKVEASKLLAKPNVQIYLQEHVSKARHRIVELVDSEKPDVALRASQDILDREHGKAVQRQEVQSVGVTLNIDLTGTSQQK